MKLRKTPAPGRVGGRARTAGAWLRVIGWCLFLPQLPDPERSRLNRERFGWNLAFSSGWIGFVQMGVGLGLFSYLCYQYILDFEALQFEQMEKQTTFNMGYLIFSNTFAWVSFLFTPRGFFLLYFFMEGGAKWLAYLIAQLPLPSLMVAAPLKAYQYANGTYRRRKRERALGPAEPDRVRAGGRGAARRITVVASRPKPGWSEVLTVEIRGERWQIDRIYEAPVGEFLRIHYELSPWPLSRLIRRIVTYDVAGDEHLAPAAFETPVRPPAPAPREEPARPKRRLPPLLEE